MSCGEMWSKICHVETFLHMINVETNFLSKSILLRFTRFCVEKNLLRNCACGEKRTNMRYAPMTDQGFCRVGKRGGSWDGLVDGGSPRGLMSDGRHQALAAEVSWQPAEPRPLLTLLPR